MKSLFILFIASTGLLLGQQEVHFTHEQTILYDIASMREDIPPVNILQSTEPTMERKSPAIAVLYSLLLPGMGELYVGDYSSGKYFTVAEGGLWLTWTSFRLYGSWQQDDARSFAAQHAALSSTGLSDQFFIDIGNFISRDAFNAQVVQDRDPEKVYNPASPQFNWVWDSDANREAYRSQRLSSETAFNNSKFVVAAIAVNHLVSAINAARLAVSHNKNIDQAHTLDIHASVLGDIAHPDGILISFSKQF